MYKIYGNSGQNITIFKILCTKYMASSEAMTSSTHFNICIVISMFPEIKICVTSMCHKLPYFSTNFHQIFTFHFC